MKSKKRISTSELHCGFCGKEFKYASERKRHEQSHSPQFECSVCSKKFSFISALRRHEKQHERTGSVACQDCNRKFRDESLLKRHIKYAHKGHFACTKCDAIFSSELALCSHSKSHKPVSERKYHCSFQGCTKSFNFSHHLKHHELTHTNMKQHYCNVCGKGFIQSHHLKSHKKTHEPDKWVVCGVSGCKKTFPTEYARKKHVATHNRKSKPGDMPSENNSSSDVLDSIQEEQEPDTIECASCKRILLRQNYNDHIPNCIKSDEIGLTVDKDRMEGKSVKPEPVKIDINDNFGSCKSFVGGCILGAQANSNDSCLCAQISAVLPTDYELEATEKLNSKVFNDSDIVKPNSIDSPCEGCECACSFKSDIVAPNCKDALPDVVEYRTDGTIRIKEMFDFDVDTCNNDHVELVPYSCKSVLGNCIVSGNGTIGDGCLCARMAIDDQQMMTQEIEELTPCPKKVN